MTQSFSTLGHNYLSNSEFRIQNSEMSRGILKKSYKKEYIKKSCNPFLQLVLSKQG